MEFESLYQQQPTHKVKSCGRVEMIGNHTDHNHGICCAFTCDLMISGLLAKRDDNLVKIYSSGFGEFSVNLKDLKIKKHEIGTSNGLVRGIARYFVDHGFNIGGFNLSIESTIYAGAGVSSSAAFETLIAQIFNTLFNDSKIDKLTIAKAGQYAENTDFGKNSGLLDQIGTGFGNISFIDFKNIDQPVVENIAFPFNDLNFVLVNTGGSHASLTHLYAAIPNDMKNAAKKLGVEFLRETSKDKLDSVELSDIEKSRAIHFFDENNRVLLFKEALLNNDKNLLFKAINESRESSTNYLKNMMVEDCYEGSPLEACDFAMKLLGSNGACRINGGGFAGSIVCIVPDGLLDNFITTMSEKYGTSNVKVVHIDPVGPYISKI